MASALPQALQNNQIREMNVRNQDLVAWLKSVSHAFEANNIQGNRQIAVVGTYLIEMTGKLETPKSRETIDQYILEMVALFRWIKIVRNLYSEAMKAQIFVKSLQPDLELAVGLFMPETL
ncbi:12968_t:CDS:2 [Dentiscutata heterogama]|uniref:12968_t:CDS:1 n=1 Tax=Dentiscutata heterogama TaxID=1316150 RepID=A0ACA9L5Q5_9GLOM|nr:12968_t:CDS:2 [Dentiscutata heterogama]